MSGADPAIPGYDPDISAELYTTNGDVDSHMQEAHGTLGFTPETINGLKRAYRTLYRKGLSLEEARRELEAQAEECPPVREILVFLSQSKRGIIR